MDLNRSSSHGANELFRAQSHIYKHAFSYANSFCLNCALQLGIPDVIHNHNHPMSHPELVSALQLPPEKSSPLHRVMSLLVHLGFFSTTKIDSNQEEEEGYVLTPSSRLLLRDEITNLSPFARAMVDPVLVNPWRSLGDWFLGKEQSQLTPFETAFGVGMWEYCDRNPEFNNVFNEAMASDSRMMSLVVKDCKEVFEGLETLVDVGGGTGFIAKIILEAFPRIKCTVFDLPHVVADLPEKDNLTYVGGDMFQSIPSADAILFKV